MPLGARPATHHVPTAGRYGPSALMISAVSPRAARSSCLQSSRGEGGRRSLLLDQTSRALETTRQTYYKTENDEAHSVNCSGDISALA